MVMEGWGGGDCPNLSQSVCAGTGVEPRVGWLVVCRGWQADSLAGWLKVTVWAGGGVAWSVISVMICMDVSLSGSGTRL